MSKPERKFRACRGFNLVVKKLYQQLQHDLQKSNDRKTGHAYVVNLSNIEDSLNKLEILIGDTTISRKEKLLRAIHFYNNHRRPELKVHPDQYIVFTLNLAEYQVNKLQNMLDIKRYPNAVLKHKAYIDLYTEVKKSINNITNRLSNGRVDAAYDDSADDKVQLMLFAVLSKIDHLLVLIDRARKLSALGIVRRQCAQMISGCAEFEKYLLALYQQYEFTSEYFPRRMDQYNQWLYVSDVITQLKIDLIDGGYVYYKGDYFIDMAIDPIIDDFNLKLRTDIEPSRILIRTILQNHIKRLYDKMKANGVHSDQLKVNSEVINMLLILYEQVVGEAFDSNLTCDHAITYYINADQFLSRR